MNKTDILFDHHLHSEFSQDSKEPLENIVRDAIAKGKTAVVATDHSDLFYQDRNFFCADIPAYDKKVAELSEKYPQIKIMRGSEIGYETAIHDRCMDFAKEHKFDLVIASIHNILGGKDMAMELINAQGDWNWSDDLVRDCYEETLRAVTNFKYANILGHIDYFLRYSKKIDKNTFPEKEELFIAIFEAMKKNNIALEMNIGGLRSGLGYPHPMPYLLGLYKKVGGKMITLGSDAHKREYINKDFDIALSYMASMGFSEFTSFDTGEPRQLKISDYI